MSEVFFKNLESFSSFKLHKNVSSSLSWNNEIKWAHVYIQKIRIIEFLLYFIISRKVKVFSLLLQNPFKYDFFSKFNVFEKKIYSANITTHAEIVEKRIQWILFWMEKTGHD